MLAAPASELQARASLTDLDRDRGWTSAGPICGWGARATSVSCTCPGEAPTASREVRGEAAARGSAVARPGEKPVTPGRTTGGGGGGGAGTGTLRGMPLLTLSRGCGRTGGGGGRPWTPRPRGVAGAAALGKPNRGALGDLIVPPPSPTTAPAPSPAAARVEGGSELAPGHLLRKPPRPDSAALPSVSRGAPPLALLPPLPALPGEPPPIAPPAPPPAPPLRSTAPKGGPPRGFGDSVALIKLGTLMRSSTSSTQSSALSSRPGRLPSTISSMVGSYMRDIAPGGKSPLPSSMFNCSACGCESSSCKYGFP